MRLFKDYDSVNNDFLIQLEDTVIKLSKSPSKVKGVHYKPSALNCLRHMFYYRTSTEIDEADTKTASSISILHSGEDRHKRIQDAISHMKECGYDCEWVDIEQYISENNITDLEVMWKKEYETCCLNKKFDLLFLCDGVVKYNGRYYIIEIKTESSKSFFNRIGVAEEHKRQAICYSLSLNINSVIFIYENRDICLKKCYVFNITAEMKKSVEEIISLCNKYVQDNILPKVVPNLSSKMCKYCDYRLRCSKESY